MNPVQITLPAAAPSRDEIDRMVADVLAQPRFQGPPESVWDRMLERLARWVGSLIANVVDLVGGPVIAGVLALLLLAVLTAMAVTRIARRRAAVIEDRISLERLLDEGADPEELERIAGEAARRGDHGRAVRALFVAGLLRLARRGVIVYRRGTTTAEMADQIRSEDFDALVADFDRIAYGNRAADADDLARAEQGWRVVLEGVRRRA